VNHDTDGTERPVCPHCGYADDDGDDESYVDRYEDCQRCDKEYFVSVNRIITYDTSIPRDTPAERAEKQQLANLEALKLVEEWRKKQAAESGR
jgi:hypothetical protein